MVQLLLSGCNGRMGHAVEAICAAEPELELTAGFDLLGADIRDFPVYASPAEFQGAELRPGTQDAPCAGHHRL